MSYRRILLLLPALLFIVPSVAMAQKLTRKQLLKERVELQRTIDSLKSVIGGSVEEISDTTQLEEEVSTSTLGNVDGEQFADVASGSNAHSGHSIWHIHKRIALNEVEGNLDSTVLTSSISNQVYLEGLKRIRTAIPLAYNDIVKNYIIFYTEKMPSRASDILGLSAYYLPAFEKIFESYGLPKELSVMAIVESALNPAAISIENAKGMWQFMYKTALQYNLKINSYIDERFDPFASAHAAAKYLRDSYTVFGDWYLAITAFNCGVGNVNKAISRAASRDFWKVYPYLPREARGYVPSFIAALYLLEYHKEYNLNPTIFSTPEKAEAMKINRNVHFEQISGVIGIPMEELKNYNPKYTQNIIPGLSGECILQLPCSYATAFKDREQEIYSYRDSLYFSDITKESVKERSSKPSSGGYITHRVKKGETLGRIAAKYHVSLQNLMKWNGLSSRSVLRIGQSIKIYSGKGPSVSQGSSKSQAKTTSSGGYQWYTIKKGDTLYDISIKCKVPLNTILKLNGLKKNSKIYPGKKLKIKKL